MTAITITYAIRAALCPACAGAGGQIDPVDRELDECHACHGTGLSPGGLARRERENAAELVAALEADERKKTVAEIEALRELLGREDLDAETLVRQALDAVNELHCRLCPGDYQ